MFFLRRKSINYPKLTITISLLFTIIISFGINSFIVDDDFFKMFPKDMSSRLLWEDMTDEFGDSEFLFIAFGNQDSDIYNIETINSVKNLTDAIKQINVVDKVISLSTVNIISVDPDDDEELYTDKLFPKKKLNSNDIFKAKKYLDTNPDIKNRLISNDEKYTAIAVRSIVKDNNQNYRNNTDLMNDISPLVDKYLNNYKVHYAGNPYITGAVPELIKSDASKLILSGLFIMVLFLYLNIRNVKAVLMILLVIILSLVSMNGFMGWMFFLTKNTIFNFTMISTSMPIVLLTIANSDGVHVVTHFFKQLRYKQDNKIAINSTMKAMGLPIFLTSLTTIIAFLAMFYAPITQLMGYGIVLSFGIFWAWFLSNTLLPSMLLLSTWDLKANFISKLGFLEKFINSLGNVIFHYPRRTLLIGASFVLFGLVGISLLKVEVNIIKFFKPDNSIRQSTEFVDQNFGGTMSLLMRINGNMDSPKTLKRISQIQDYIETHPEVKMTASLSDLIKEAHKTLYNDDDFYSIPDSLNQVRNLLFMLPKEQKISFVNTTTYKTGMVHTYLTSLSTDEIVTISNDIENYINQTSNGQLEIETSGLMIILKDFISMIIESSIISIAVSIIAIFTVSFLFFRRLIWAALSVMPLSSAVILNFGLMGIFGVKLSHLTALLTSIIIGVGVDFAVHYISSYRRHCKKQSDASKISMLTIKDVGYPIMLDVVSNMGFAALLFSDIVPLNYMGGLMIFAMISTSFGTFLLMGTTIEIITKNNGKII